MEDVPLKRICGLLILLTIFMPVNAQAAEKIPILVYHSIAEYKGHGDQELYVAPDVFEKQVLYLREHGFTPLTFEDWGKLDKVEKPIFLTFDDGYKNNLQAFAVFQKLQTNDFLPKGTFFVISDFIGRKNRLSENDLKRLASSNLISVQSHTATHPDLTKTENLEDELKGSKETIEQITSKPVVALSYPFGSFNERVIRETRKVYEFGLTTTPEYYMLGGKKEENAELPRLYVTGSMTMDEFADLVEGKKKEGTEIFPAPSKSYR